MEGFLGDAVRSKVTQFAASLCEDNEDLHSQLAEIPLGAE